MKNQLGNTTLKTLVAAVVSISFAGAAQSMPVVFGNNALQGVLDGITVAPSPTPGASSTNVNTDQISDSLDSNWAISGSGGSFAQLIVELAGFQATNELWIYDSSNMANQVLLFSGADAAGAQKILTFGNDGSVNVNFADTGIDFADNSFGYALKVNATGNTFYSDTSKNADGLDHMVAYQGTGVDTIDLPSTLPGTWGSNEYIMAWEDLAGPLGGGSDRDFTDFVVIAESISPSPISEPSMLALLGLGLLGFVGGRRLNKK